MRQNKAKKQVSPLPINAGVQIGEGCWQIVFTDIEPNETSDVLAVCDERVIYVGPNAKASIIVDAYNQLVKMAVE